MGMGINVFGSCLGVDNLLAAVEAVVSGEHIADSNGNQIIRHALETKKLKGNQQGCNRAVSDAAENTHHTASGTKGSRQTKKRSDDTSQGCTDEE